MGMEKFLKRAVIISLFGLPISLFTLASIVFMTPMFMLFDWLGNSNPDFDRAFEESLGMWHEFTTKLRAAS